MVQKSIPIGKIINILKRHKTQNSLILLLLLTVTFIGSYVSHMQFVSILFLSIFPGIFIIPVKRTNFLFAAPMILGLSLLYIALSTTLLNLLGMSISLPSALIVTFIGSLAIVVAMLIWPPKQTIYKLLDSVDNKTLVPIYLLFIFAFVSRVVSTFNAPVPLVHDPEAHAFWALRIINEKSINYFYSPGLHIWTALVSLISETDSARITNILTNFLSALSVLYWGIAGLVISQKRIVGLFTAFFVLIAPVPTNLYYIAGKNSLIAALPFIGILLVVNHFYLKKRTYYTGLLLILVLAGIGIVHYPAFVYAAFYTLLLFLISQLLKLKKIGLIHFIRQYLLMIVPVLLSFMIVGSVILITNQRDVKEVIFRSSEAAETFHRSAPLLENLNDGYTPPVNEKSERNLIPHNPVKQIIELPKEFARFINKTSENLGMILAGLIILMIYFLINELNKRRGKEIETIVAATLILSLLLVMLAFRIVQIKTFDLIPETGLFLIFVFASLGLALMLDSINKLGYFTTCCVVLVFGAWTSHQIFQKYSLRSTKFSLVNSNDVKAFSWIKANIPKKDGFVGLSKLNPTRNQIVYPADGALWLPVITGNPVATPNQDSGFVAVKSHVNYEYMLMLSKDPEAQKKALRYFSENNYLYIYVDGDNGYKKLGVKQLLDSKLVKVIYENSEIKILKIN